MVGMVAAASRERIASRIHTLKHVSAAATDVALKLGHLRRLREELAAVNSLLLVEFLAPILDLLSDGLSPVRKLVTQIVGEIGLKHLELLPEIVPALLNVLKDDTPAVARQAISCGIDIFRCSLVKFAIQGLYSSEFNESTRSAWASALKFRDEIYSMASQVGNDGRRLPALKFVESVVLLYTPDPNGSLEPPPDQICEGKFEEFNVSWLRGGHPMLNVRDLSAEASKSLGLLLDQLRFPSLKSHSYLMIVLLIKSLSAVATKRPAFYGRILPVLLGLDPSNAVGKGMHLAGVHHALKNAFESCLNCSHPGAAPWRERLVSALNEIKVGRPTEPVANEFPENFGKTDWTSDSHEEKPAKLMLMEKSTASRKRAAVLSTSDFTEDDNVRKRGRSTPENSGSKANATSEGLERAHTPSSSDADNGPVQQLVAMFGALVAQGEKAVASLEILISSISADLLAEVVMANMRNLPLRSSQSEEDEELLDDMADHPDTIGSDNHIKHLSLLLTDILSQSKSSPTEVTGTEDLHHSVSNELEQTQEEEEPKLMSVDDNAAYDDMSYASLQATAPITDSVFPEDNPSEVQTGFTVTTSEVDDDGLENEIPGLASSSQDERMPEYAADSSKDLAELDDPNQDKFTNVVGSLVESDRISLELANSISVDKSEELSSKEAIMDTNSMNSSTATSIGLISQLILPKLSAPVIHLADEQKDKLQELAFVRIVDAYKQVPVSGGSELRFSILAHSGSEFPSELDPWKLLKAHILSDYVNREGHELTLRVLYRLFGEAEEDSDFFISTTATSAYETFLLHVAETLRDSFPASDKSLSRLLGEVPYLPKSIFEMLERLCTPGMSDNDGKELHSGDRVTQGLMAVWSLILLRPPIRDACLKIALKVLLLFPRLVSAPLDKFQVALSRVLQGFNNSIPVLTPAEALIAIHGIDPERDGIPLKKVTDACNACFEQPHIFTQQVLAKVLNQLVEQIPLPMLFMRTVLQAIGAFPSLVEFIMEILSRLVSKQIWKYPKLWVGFVKCALLTKPQSFGVLLQLPSAQLENALNRTPALKVPLTAHASQPNIRSSLPRSTQMVLGLVSEPQTSAQTQQPMQTQTQTQIEAGDSEKETVTEKLKESSSTAS
ncbi:HEAT repeat-containing protein [Striga hermonthica]|uniref:HEAT repeat-containing protein n=1 Tax=Striga hermonthica TaxID=68872 RepID=A0A9N7RLD6_STRHE|nr:HEAT repeat-containing protein [Striga hermonthica]